MLLREFVQRAVDIASRAQDTTVNRLAIEAAAEPLLPVVFNAVSRRMAGDSNTRQLLRRPNTVAFTNGVATLAESILTEYLCESTLYDSATLSSLYTYIPEWHDFVRYSDSRLGSYTVNESTAYVVQPAAVYVAGAGLTGNLTLVSPSIIAVPTVITNPIVCRDELLDDLLMELASRLGGAAVAHG